MRGFSNLYGGRRIRGASVLALAIALANTSSAMAQSSATQDSSRQDAAEGTGEGEVIVTGSRIERAGFNQPTPTTVIGDTEIRVGARPNIQQVLNDQPQFRPTTTPQVSVGNTSSGTAPADLRGLGADRTLTLINGRRFVGASNLNLVPLGLVDRVEVVTGGASAAYGSGAVAGVVNIILKKKVEGLAIGASNGISSRGDGARYGLDATFGTDFAGGAGHFMVGAEYLDDKGVADRSSRKNLGSSGLVALDPTKPNQRTLVRDLNLSPLGGYYTPGGLITTGALAGQTFNQDGTLRPFNAPNARGIGGSDARALFDDVALALPVRRLNAYARASYDVGAATFWVDGTFGRSHVDDGKFLPDYLASANGTAISARNPYLSSAIRNQLAAAGQTSFTFMRDYNDIYGLRFDAVRSTYEGAVGVDGSIGSSGIKYNAHYSHGELVANQRVKNSTLFPQFNNAINAVTNAAGQIVCGINADAVTTNDDAACAPLNPFGENNASEAALAYTRGTQYSHTVTKLDSAAAQIQADLFSLWAGPITGLLGAEARWEEVKATNGELDRKAAFGGLSIYTSPVSGGFNVKEGFGEIAAPIVDSQAIKIDLNGAARYSDYSTSGGIWSWKYGGTVRLFGDLLLRGTHSRDIRSPNVNDLFAVQSLTIGPVADRDTANRPAGYNASPTLVSTYRGGNRDLVPEIGKTLTFGGSYSPSFVPRLNLSVDYYDIKISGAIATLSGSDLSAACAAGNTAACTRVLRDPTTQTITQVFANAQNIASFKTRGIDFEASYLLPLSQLSANMPGTLRIRALASHVDRVIFDTGASVAVNVAGDVGEAVTYSTPKWRGTLSFAYQTDRLGLDARVRYVGGGTFNQLYDGVRNPVTLLNNHINSRTYLDLGAQYKVNDRFTFFASVANLFDRDPPISTAGPVHYDAIGTYATFGARVKF